MVEHLYKVLGISSTATVIEIKKAYRNLAKEYHPDKNKNGAEKFKEVNNAYTILIDPEKKRDYILKHGLSSTNNEDQYANPFSHTFFKHYTPPFASQARPPSPPPPPPPPQESDYIIKTDCSISLEDVYNGSTVKMKFKETINCSLCHGNYKDCKRFKTCEHCAGKGTTSRIKNRKVVGTVRCTSCLGRGRTKYYVLCKKCENKRFVNRTVPVRVPKGVHKGHGLQARNLGNLMPDEVTRGAVIFRVTVEEHNTFQRRGDHLYLNVKISLKEALMGFKNKTLCTHLDGRIVTATQPCGKVIKPNAQRVVKGEGMPIFGSNTNAYGDLHVTFQVEFPDSVQVPDSKMAKTAIDQFFETEEERKAKANAIVIDDEEDDVDKLQSEYKDSNNDDVEMNHLPQTNGEQVQETEANPYTDNTVLEEYPQSCIVSESDDDSIHSSEHDGNYADDDEYNIFSRGFPSLFSNFF